MCISCTGVHQFWIDVKNIAIKNCKHFANKVQQKIMLQKKYDLCHSTMEDLDLSITIWRNCYVIIRLRNFGVLYLFAVVIIISDIAVSDISFSVTTVVYRFCFWLNIILYIINIIWYIIVKIPLVLLPHRILLRP